MSGIPESLSNVQDSTGIPHSTDNGSLSQTSRDRQMKREVILQMIRIREWIIDQQATEE